MTKASKERVEAAEEIMTLAAELEDASKELEAVGGANVANRLLRVQSRILVVLLEDVARRL